MDVDLIFPTLEFPNAGPLVSWFSFLFSRSGLEPVLLRGTDVEFVHTELDEFLRIAASINDGLMCIGWRCPKRSRSETRQLCYIFEYLAGINRIGPRMHDFEWHKQFGDETSASAIIAMKLLQESLTFAPQHQPLSKCPLVPE